MSRRLQPLLFLLIAIAALLAWQWAGESPQPAGEGGVTASQTMDTGVAPGVVAPDAGDSRAVRPPPTPADASSPAPSLPAFLPGEAAETLALIVRNGPFPYRQDGAVFQNRERRLPERTRGYYREYTVRTPGSPDRGARRIVTGGETGDAPPREYYYTADHYRSFRSFEYTPAQESRQ